MCNASTTTPIEPVPNTLMKRNPSGTVTSGEGEWFERIQGGSSAPTREGDQKSTLLKKS